MGDGLLLGLDDGVAAHRSTLVAAQERMETGLAQLSSIARGSNRELTPEGEADDDVGAISLEEELVAPVHRRLGHVLMALAPLGRDGLHAAGGCSSFQPNAF